MSDFEVTLNANLSHQSSPENLVGLRASIDIDAPRKGRMPSFDLDQAAVHPWDDQNKLNHNFNVMKIQKIES
jgi:hypothetical protein